MLLRRCCKLQIYHPRRWSRNGRNLTYYANKMRTYDWMKTNDSSLVAEFKRALFMVLVDKLPLVKPTSTNIGYIVPLVTYQDLRHKLSEFSIELNPALTALMDVVPMQSDTNDVFEEFLPVLALGLKQEHFKSANDVSRFSEKCGGKLVDLRSAIVGCHLQEQAHLLAKASVLLQWAAIYRFCPTCSAPLQMNASKTAATCQQCSTQFYPPVYPVGICVITDSNHQHCLLVRLPTSVPGMFTAVSGFSEPGETLEMTVRREIVEEIGIDVTDIHYAGVSQPWPFPHGSMMCGFYATADVKQPLDINVNELEDAGWFSREEVEGAFRNTEQTNPFYLKNRPVPDKRFTYIPPKGTLSHHLIKNWLNYVQ